MKKTILLLLVIFTACSSLQELTNPYYQKIPEPAVKTEYDKFDQYYSFTTTENYVFQKPGHAVTSNASYICVSNKACEPKNITLRFANNSVRWIYIDLHRLVFLVDGKSYPMSTTYDGSIISSRQVLEQMSADVDASLFNKIAFSKDVHAKLGTDTLNMNYANREVYRKLISQVESNQ